MDFRVKSQATTPNSKSITANSTSKLSTSSPSLAISSAQPSTLKPDPALTVSNSKNVNFVAAESDNNVPGSSLNKLTAAQSVSVEKLSQSDVKSRHSVKEKRKKLGGCDNKELSRSKQESHGQAKSSTSPTMGERSNPSTSTSAVEVTGKGDAHLDKISPQSRHRKHQGSLKRKFVICDSSASDDEEDFDIKKPNRQHSKESSIVISDDSEDSSPC